MIKWYDWVIAIYTANIVTTSIFIMISTTSSIGYMYCAIAILSALFAWNSYCNFRYRVENNK